jgi:hypothetical protein
MSAAPAHDEGHGLWPVVGVILLCILVVLVLIALAFQKDTTTFFLKLNDIYTNFFENPTFIKLRFVFGILTVALAGLATWLFFRLLEMEKEHEDHVYHHTDHIEHTHESAHTGEHVQPQIPVAEHHAEESIPIQESEPRVKTAPPPTSMYKQGLPGESGVRGVQKGEGERAGHYQWQSVLRLATSQNPSDWKLAIIEADVILDMMTYIQGFQGDTLGERLKNADPGSFKNLDFAKKAHWTRNQIAHDPTVQFTPRDINQAIRMYEAALNEFKYI